MRNYGVFYPVGQGAGRAHSALYEDNSVSHGHLPYTPEKRRMSLDCAMYSEADQLMAKLKDRRGDDSTLIERSHEKITHIERGIIVHDKLRFSA